MKRRIIDMVSEKPWLGWVIFGCTVLIVFLIGVFGASIIERRQEAQLAYQMVKPIGDWEPRNEIWGENFPREFESYQSTMDTTFASRHGGSKTIDYLERYPNLVVLWAGYAFSREYNQGRGHYHAVEDIRNTLRTGMPQPGTCWSCKSTDVPRVMNIMGPENFYKSKWLDLGPEIINNIGCQDCHDPKTMNLRITRPALIEAFERQGRDINKATHQEMRSLVCAQCHVEYYFKGEGKYLTFPWDKGMGPDETEAYYDEVQHVDFVHALSKTPILKAQHPDYEMFLTGIHADRGVSCADCHMPYKSEGGVKFTDHKIQSPLNNISNSCQVCHRQTEEQLRENVEERQTLTEEMRGIVENELVKAHLEAKCAWDKGATETEMKPVLQLIRHAQWRWDWVAAANSLGFHSPIKAERTLGTALQRAQEARVLIARVLARHGMTEPVAMPDLSTKAKAQVFIGLDMAKFIAEKTDFKKNILPQWDSKGKERQAAMPVPPATYAK
jgi:nitrite reductase (cytochrome c-552)